MTTAEKNNITKTKEESSVNVNGPVDLNIALIRRGLFVDVEPFDNCIAPLLS